MRVLYVNPRSGAGRNASEVRTAAAARGIRVLELGDDLPAEATAVGVAGGDGSLAGVVIGLGERDVEADDLRPIARKRVDQRGNPGAPPGPMSFGLETFFVDRGDHDGPGGDKWSAQLEPEVEPVKLD